MDVLLADQSVHDIDRIDVGDSLSPSFEFYDPPSEKLVRWHGLHTRFQPRIINLYMIASEKIKLEDCLQCGNASTERTRLGSLYLVHQSQEPNQLPMSLTNTENGVYKTRLVAMGYT